MKALKKFLHHEHHISSDGLLCENGFISPHQELDFCEHLGSGSFGTIYKGKYHLYCCGNREEVLDVAVKEIKGRKRIAEKELKSLLELRSEREIVHLYNYYEQGKNALFVTELCAGGDLITYAMREKLTEDMIKTIIRWLLVAIEKCHAHGICHTDVKLDNIGLLRKGDLSELKLLDFGNSVKVSEGPYIGRTLWGSKSYLAPELRAKPKDMFAREEELFPIDIWCVGVVMHCLLFQEFPRNGKCHLQGAQSDVSMDLLHRLLDRDPKTRITVQDALEHPFLK